MKKIAQRDDIRELILDGVDALLSRYGYRKMTMEDLARQVGIGKGTVYLHFPGKEEVTLSHIDRIVDLLVNRLRGISRGPEPLDERLRKMLAERVLYRFDRVQHYSESLNDLLSALRPALLARRQSYFKKEASVFEALLKKGTRSGIFYCASPRATSWALLHATNSLLPYSLSTRELGSRKDIEGRVREVAELLIRGLMKPAPTLRRKTRS